MESKLVCAAAVMSLMLSSTTAIGKPGNHRHYPPIRSAHLKHVPIFTAKEEAKKAGMPFLAQFPPAGSGTAYTIKPDEANLYISRLVLPANFVLSVDPNTPEINWNVGQIIVGENALIDLSGSRDGGVKPGAPREPDQAAKCKDGGTGNRGTNGVSGKPGKNLTIRGVEQISGDGSLWIETDGGIGGPAGDGSRGGKGGGPRNHVWVDACLAGNGGGGGQPGTPGAGGAVSKVSIILADGTTPIPSQTAPSPACAPSTRPSAANGPTGIVQIWGAVGCSGKPGSVGPSGLYGDQ